MENVVFGGLRVEMSPAVPDDEVWLCQDGRRVCRIVNLGKEDVCPPVTSAPKSGN